MKKLSDIVNSIEAIQVVGNAEAHEIKDITIDSREVKEGSLFVAIKGYKTDGHQYIQEAINKGATAVVLDNIQAIPSQIFTHTGVAKVVVSDSRKALAQASDMFYGNPSRKLKLIGVTGTKGKTTTTYFLKNILETAGHKVGLIGTIKNMIGGKEIATKLTTPESNRINGLMAEMIEEDCTYCIMEVSSHSLELYRVYRLDFDYAIFTNITADHFDFHKTFDHYLAAKKMLFDMIKPEGKIICNGDDESWKAITANAKADVITYGLNEGTSLKLSDITFSVDGTSFNLTNEGNGYELSTKLIGKFNAYNATAAFGVAVTDGIDPETIVKGINTTPQVPGRFEVISKGDKRIVIDYSHTSDSLKKALEALKSIAADKHRIHTVFGCGGDRDKTKRPIMGRIAEEFSDRVYVTSDNPRTEDPNAIIKDILTGLREHKHVTIESREEAIKKAITESEPNAIVLIAGKGHETYQEVHGVRNYFSDKETAEKYLN